MKDINSSSLHSFTFAMSDDFYNAIVEISSMLNISVSDVIETFIMEGAKQFFIPVDDYVTTTN